MLFRLHEILVLSPLQQLTAVECEEVVCNGIWLALIPVKKSSVVFPSPLFWLIPVYLYKGILLTEGSCSVGSGLPLNEINFEIKAVLQ